MLNERNNHTENFQLIFREVLNAQKNYWWMKLALTLYRNVALKNFQISMKCTIKRARDDGGSCRDMLNNIWLIFIRLLTTSYRANQWIFLFDFYLHKKFDLNTINFYLDIFYSYSEKKTLKIWFFIFLTLELFIEFYSCFYVNGFMQKLWFQQNVVPTTIFHTNL